MATEYGDFPGTLSGNQKGEDNDLNGIDNEGNALIGDVDDIIDEAEGGDDELTGGNNEADGGSVTNTLSGDAGKNIAFEAARRISDIFLQRIAVSYHERSNTFKVPHCAGTRLLANLHRTASTGRSTAILPDKFRDLGRVLAGASGTSGPQHSEFALSA